MAYPNAVQRTFRDVLGKGGFGTVYPGDRQRDGLPKMTTAKKTPSSGYKSICIFCEKKFKSFCNLTTHMRTHTMEKPFDCKKCSHSANTSGNIKLHMRIHTGEKPHKCRFCNKAFYHNSHLNWHLRTHTGEKPHKCELCGKRFALSSHLQQHIRTHTLEKPYKCEICSKNFTRSSGVKIHKANSHNIDRHKFTIPCVFCNKEKFKQHYLTHILSHTSESPHICRFCSREFCAKSSKKHHELNCEKRPFKK